MRGAAHSLRATRLYLGACCMCGSNNSTQRRLRSSQRRARNLGVRRGASRRLFRTGSGRRAVWQESGGKSREGYARETRADLSPRQRLGFSCLYPDLSTRYILTQAVVFISSVSCRGLCFRAKYVDIDEVESAFPTQAACYQFREFSQRLPSLDYG